MKINRAGIPKDKDAVFGSNNYDAAIDHIKQAIDLLGQIAADDKLAKEAIANLGVVILDLTEK